MSKNKSPKESMTSPCTFEWQGAECGEQLSSTRHQCHDLERNPSGPNANCGGRVGYPNLGCHQFVKKDKYA
jgi:hypothetical protein